MKRIIYILFAVVSIIVTLSGCNVNSERGNGSTLSSQERIESILLEHLSGKSTALEKLQGSVQVIEKKYDGDTFECFIRKAIGDAQTLYIIYDVTFPEEVDLTCGNGEDITPAICQLEKKDGSILVLDMWDTEILVEDGQTRTFLTSFCSWDTWKSNEAVNFSVGKFQKTDGYNETIITDEVARFTWNATNHTECLEKEINLTDGENGKIRVSPFGLSFVMESTNKADLTPMIDGLEILFIDGHTTKPKGATSGTHDGEEMQVLIRFYNLMDLDAVEGVLIGEDTILFQ